MKQTIKKVVAVAMVLALILNMGTFAYATGTTELQTTEANWETARVKGQVISVPNADTQVTVSYADATFNTALSPEDWSVFAGSYTIFIR